VSNITEPSRRMVFNARQGGGGILYSDSQDGTMLLAVIVTLIIVAALGYALRSEHSGVLIARRPYNNRYNDAAGAREDHLS